MTANDIRQPATAQVMSIRAAAMSQTSPTSSINWRGAVLGAAALVLTCGWLFWDFVQRQIKMAIEHQADWGHTLVIPLIAGYFVYLQRDRILARPLKTTWFGLVIMLVGVGLYMLCTAGPLPLRHHNVQGACVAIAVTGIVLLFCGWHAMRWLAFPLAYMFVFSQYISERLLHTVTFKMQDITAQGAGGVLSLFLDISREGNILFIHRGGQSLPLNIAEACSGMRMLMAFLALGAALAFTGLRHPWQRVLLVLLGVPTAVVVNILRVCTLGVLTLWDSGFAAGDFHSFIGLVWLVPALFMFLGLMWIIRHLVIEEDAPARRASAA